MSQIFGMAALARSLRRASGVGGVLGAADVSPLMAQLGAPPTALVRPRSMGQFTMGSGRWERVSALTTTGTTWEYIRRCPLPFDAIQVCLSVGQTSGLTAATPNSFVAAVSVPTLADADVTTATATLITFAGSSPTVPPSPAFQRRTYQWSDVIRLNSVPATDGLGGYLLDVRATLYMASGTGNVITMGDTPAADSFAAWQTHPTRPFRLLSKGGSYAASSWSGMSLANSTVANTGPIGMVRLLYRGAVVNVLTIGDSTDDGRGTYLGDGAASKACSLLSTGPVVFEHTNIGWSGASAQLIYQNLIDYIAGGSKADIAFLLAFYTNNVASAAIPSSGNFSIPWMHGYRALMESALDNANIRAVLQTSQPANFAVRPWGTSDSLRIAEDVDLRAMASHGRIVFDKGKPMTGPVDGNGQRTIINSDDGIHQNDAGLALQAPLAAAAIASACYAPTGLLAA